MKRILCLIMLLAHSLVGKSESCDPPPVAIEFLQAEYVFYGTTGKKNFSKDYSIYDLDVKVLHHFKQTKTQPKSLTFTFSTDISPEFSHIPILKRGLKAGVSYVIFAHRTANGFQFFTSCSNSRSYKSYNDIGVDFLQKLEAGNEIELDSITFDAMTVGSHTWEMTYPTPKGSLDTLMSPLINNTYLGYSKEHYESFVLYINEMGILEKIVAIRNAKYSSRWYHDVILSTFIPLPNIPTPLQNDVLMALPRYKLWNPAIFIGKPVKYKAFFQIYFDKEMKLKPTIIL